MTLLLALLAVATWEERSEDLSGRWEKAESGYRQVVPLKDAPFVRLSAPRDARLWWNGTPLTVNENGDFDAPSLRRENVLEARAAVAVVLRITPRVYIASQKLTVAGGRLEARLAVRNTLENTVNAFVTIYLPTHKKEWTATATVPPGVTQTVEFGGACPTAERLEFLTVVEKQEEAMEAGYRFQTRTILTP
ncbi:MAG: hypothetical protein JNN08_18600 [Bryobacterales bacterium]|nr:hypothetical protein [Bryobacterales bacterium]